MFNQIIAIFISIILGLFIGYEREKQNKPAGLRTITLVCLGATLFTIISILLRDTSEIGSRLRYDIGRIIAYIIAGIGFLGSGIIIQYKNNIEGITTAGVLWSMVAVGILCGLEKFSLAIISTFCIYFILKLKLISKLRRKND